MDPRNQATDGRTTPCRYASQVASLPRPPSSLYSVVTRNSSIYQTTASSLQPCTRRGKIAPPPFPTPTQRRLCERPPASIRSLSRSAFSFALLRPAQGLGLASDSLGPPARPQHSSHDQSSRLFRRFQLTILSYAINQEFKGRREGRQTTGPRTSYPRQAHPLWQPSIHPPPSPRAATYAQASTEYLVCNYTIVLLCPPSTTLTTGPSLPALPSMTSTIPLASPTDDDPRNEATPPRNADLPTQEVCLACLPWPVQFNPVPAPSLAGRSVVIEKQQDEANLTAPQCP
ncbi:hypothetical protein QBC39DRAFT_24770 [Podospora conica]|nr:hypothetical protein QBC39DRAFT_24770 [Schizothecium conicum]